MKIQQHARVADPSPKMERSAHRIRYSGSLASCAIPVVGHPSPAGVAQAQNVYLIRILLDRSPYPHKHSSASDASIRH